MERRERENVSNVQTNHFPSPLSPPQANSQEVPSPSGFPFWYGLGILGPSAWRALVWLEEGREELPSRVLPEEQGSTPQTYKPMAI